MRRSGKEKQGIGERKREGIRSWGWERVSKKEGEGKGIEREEGVGGRGR